MPYEKPLPTLRGEERLYFEHARRHELVYQRCASCEARIFPPRSVCPSCLGTDLRLDRSAGRGSIHSFTTLHRPGHPAFADDVPYTIVLVDLDEGVRLIADIVETEPERLRVGMPVQVVFDEVSEEFTLPRFRPADASEAAR